MGGAGLQQIGLALHTHTLYVDGAEWLTLNANARSNRGGPTISKGKQARHGARMPSASCINRQACMHMHAAEAPRRTCRQRAMHALNGSIPTHMQAEGHVAAGGPSLGPIVHAQVRAREGGRQHRGEPDEGGHNLFQCAQGGAREGGLQHRGEPDKGSMQRKRPARHVHASSIALTPQRQHLLGHACHGLSSSVPPPSVQLPPTKPSLVGLPAQRRPNEVDVAALPDSLEVRAKWPTAHHSGIDRYVLAAYQRASCQAQL